jgi:signal peptidase I
MDIFNWRNRKTFKQARELVAGARKLVRINRDILRPEHILTVHKGCEELTACVRTRDAARAAKLMEKFDEQLAGIFPRPKYAGLRENLEVLLVALIVAMGVRTFFIQPFKIPTGSMQPTLFGVYPQFGSDPLAYQNGPPWLLHRLWGAILLGRIHEPNGFRTRGDHIFVDKISYHFRKPKRGEVIVFDTANIPELSAGSRGKFYIKRLVALENDKVQISPPYLRVNGDTLESMLPFKRMYSMMNGYHGYVLPGSSKYFRDPFDVYAVPSDHLFVLGDNSRHSLDGRFWGAVPSQDLVGRAILVYWPFSRRFGRID